MKNLNITFTNKEFRKIKKVKPSSWTWRAFFIVAVNAFRRIAERKLIKEF